MSNRNKISVAQLRSLELMLIIANQERIYIRDKAGQFAEKNGVTSEQIAQAKAILGKLLPPEEAQVIQEKVFKSLDVRNPKLLESVFSNGVNMNTVLQDIVIEMAENKGVRTAVVNTGKTAIATKLRYDKALNSMKNLENETEAVQQVGAFSGTCAEIGVTIGMIMGGSIIAQAATETLTVENILKTVEKKYALSAGKKSISDIAEALKIERVRNIALAFSVGLVVGKGLNELLDKEIEISPSVKAAVADYAKNAQKLSKDVQKALKENNVSERVLKKGMDTEEFLDIIADLRDSLSDDSKKMFERMVMGEGEE
ncbi:MAG: hypothetical protein WBB28_01425 [Crinalium sp.]